MSDHVNIRIDTIDPLIRTTGSVIGEIRRSNIRITERISAARDRMNERSDLANELRWVKLRQVTS
jgi:hypothetical protein